jgi:signal transduction histidine kinase
VTSRLGEAATAAQPAPSLYLTPVRWCAAAVETARPRQWPKNMLVFAAPLAGASLGRDDGIAYALVAAAAFVAASSAVYFVNDVVDAERDRRHPAWISAPPEWIDRLAGVLVDNACRYAGPGAAVRIGVGQRAGRVTLTVEDSGPGIPARQRDRLFDRFHRATEQAGGAGLGLAIADSIVRSTGGQWRIGDSPLGGALFSVSWRRMRDATGRRAR